ncbi:MAG: hypothetical protein ACU841_13870, partial [Gammaproteobacteria bacterium]
GKGRWLDNVFVERLWKTAVRRIKRRVDSPLGNPPSSEQTNPYFTRTFLIGVFFSVIFNFRELNAPQWRFAARNRPTSSAMLVFI